MKNSTLPLLAAAGLGLLLASRKDEQTNETSTFRPNQAPENMLFQLPQEQSVSQISQRGLSVRSDLISSSKINQYVKTRNPERTDARDLINRLVCCKDYGVGARPLSALEASKKQTGPINQQLSDKQLGRMTIVLSELDDFRFFSELLSTAMLLMQINPNQGPKSKAQYNVGVRLMDFFSYHRWCLGSSLVDYMGSRAYAFSCSSDSRLPLSDYRTYTSVYACKAGKGGYAATGISEDGQGILRTRNMRQWPSFYDGVYHPYINQKSSWRKCYPYRPFYCNMQDHLEDAPQVAVYEMGGEFVGWNGIKGSPGVGWRMDNNQDWQNFKNRYNAGKANNYYVANVGPCGAMIEYATARLSSLMYATQINPKLGLKIGEQLKKLAMESTSILIAAGITLGTSGGNWASLIAAAIMAAIGAIQAAINVENTIQRRRMARVKIGQKFDELWSKCERMFGLRGRYWGEQAKGASGFSGYQAQLLVKRQDVYQDIRTDDPYWHHFALSSYRPSGEFGKVAAIEQLPLLYLGVNFPFIVSANPINADLLVLNPGDLTGRFKDQMLNPQQMEQWTTQAYEKLRIVQGVAVGSSACRGRSNCPNPKG
jgi:hypothetical protein